PDGKSLLVQAGRDHSWRHADRFFTLARSERPAEQLLFDDYGSSGTLSPDGKKLLFTREGEAWWRKGYKGSRVSQVWLHDLESKSFTKVLHEEFGCRWPLWQLDGKGFYYVREHAKGSDLYRYDLAGKTSERLTKFTDGAVVFPSIARDGSRIVFRHLFDLYVYEPAGKKLKKLALHHTADRVTKKSEYRVLTTASAA